jgi:anaphase-promoting complex subunit 11
MESVGDATRQTTYLRHHSRITQTRRKTKSLKGLFSSPTMKVTINSFRAVATWKWDLPEESDDTCGICRVNFEGTCSKCKFPGDDCPIIVGECRHCFHMVRMIISYRGGRKTADGPLLQHCISDWISSDASQGKCPMCRQRMFILFMSKMVAC